MVPLDVKRSLAAQRLSEPSLPPGTRMSAYPVAAGFATSCASPGCWCRDRRPCYPSDLTDAQWQTLEPRAREVMGTAAGASGPGLAADGLRRRLPDGQGPRHGRPQNQRLPRRQLCRAVCYVGRST